MDRRITGIHVALKEASKDPGVDAVIALIEGRIAIIYQNGIKVGRGVEELSLQIVAGEEYRCTLSTTGSLPILPAVNPDGGR
ncbi:MAG: hypothetical protein AAGU32_04250 [Bacillota bacterium]